MHSIGVFQAIIIMFIPTALAFFVLRLWLRGLWLVLATPSVAVLEFSTLMALAWMRQRQGGPAILPDDASWIAGIFLGAFALAFLITLVLLAVTAAVTRGARARPPTA